MSVRTGPGALLAQGRDAQEVAGHVEGMARIRSAMKTRQLFMRPTTQTSRPAKALRRPRRRCLACARAIWSSAEEHLGLRPSCWRSSTQLTARTNAARRAGRPRRRWPGTHSTSAPGGHQGQARRARRRARGGPSGSASGSSRGRAQRRGRRAGACARPGARPPAPPPPRSLRSDAGRPARGRATRQRPSGQLDAAGHGQRRARRRAAGARRGADPDLVEVDDAPRGRRAAAAAGRRAPALRGQVQDALDVARGRRRAGRPPRASARRTASRATARGAAAQRRPVDRTSRAVARPRALAPAARPPAPRAASASSASTAAARASASRTRG